MSWKSLKRHNQKCAQEAFVWKTIGFEEEIVNLSSHTVASSQLRCNRISVRNAIEFAVSASTSSCGRSTKHYAPEFLKRIVPKTCPISTSFYAAAVYSVIIENASEKKRLRAYLAYTTISLENLPHLFINWINISMLITLHIGYESTMNVTAFRHTDFQRWFISKVVPL